MTTFPPQRSVRLLRLKTGVCRAIARALAWIRRSSSSEARVSGVGAIQLTVTTASISTRAFFGSAATPMVTRAGGSSAKNAA